MKTKSKQLICVALLWLAVTHAFAGGGWPQPKSQGYFKFAQNAIISSRYFAPDGTVTDITTIGLHTTSLYGEYGFSDRLTGILYFPLFVRSTLNAIRFEPSGRTEPGDFLNGLGDAELSLKYGLITTGPVVVSGSLLLGLPFGKPVGGRSQILQTGDGEFNQLIRIDASHSFYPKPVYISAFAGFNNRTKDFSDEIRWGAEIGFTFRKFIPILKFAAVHSLFNGNAEVLQNGVFANNTEFLSPTVELNYQPTEKWGISVSGGFAFRARNILAAPNWSAGLYFKL
jgi:hypothetical protein